MKTNGLVQIIEYNAITKAQKDTVDLLLNTACFTSERMYPSDIEDITSDCGVNNFS